MNKEVFGDIFKFHNPKKIRYCKRLQDWFASSFPKHTPRVLPSPFGRGEDWYSEAEDAYKAMMADGNLILEKSFT
jgi:hypothetical protein